MLLALSLVLLADPQPSANATSSVLAQDLPIQEHWRRTTRGWEDSRTWVLASPPALPRATAIHPSVVGSLQLLISLAALVGFSVHSEPI
jgi:hypothetical protein